MNSLVIVPPEVSETVTDPSPAPLQKHSPSGCTVDVPPSNYHWRGAYRLAARYRALATRCTYYCCCYYYHTSVIPVIYAVWRAAGPPRDVAGSDCGQVSEVTAVVVNDFATSRTGSRPFNAACVRVRIASDRSTKRQLRRF